MRSTTQIVAAGSSGFLTRRTIWPLSRQRTTRLPANGEFGSRTSFSASMLACDRVVRSQHFCDARVCALVA